MRISTDIEKNSMVLFINIGGIMQVGDTVKKGMAKQGGIILDIFEDPEGAFGALLVSVLWTDGNQTE